MKDLEHFGALVDNARYDYVRASDANASNAFELFDRYWRLLRDYNHALDLERGEPKAPGTEVLIRVTDEEYNEVGLMVKYFADRLLEANLGRSPTEDDVWQIIASDQYREVEWVSPVPLSEHMRDIIQLMYWGPSQEMAAPVDTIKTPNSAGPTTKPRGRPTKAAPRDPVEDFANQVIEDLKSGKVTWHKPWASTFPTSMSSGKPYRGINTLLLGYSALENGYKSRFWGTFNQITELGGSVNKGEHATHIIFFQPFEREELDNAGEVVGTRRGALRKSYPVFNYDQCTGLPDYMRLVPEPTISEDERIERCEAAVTAYLSNGGPALDHNGGNRAFYVPALDRISLPAFESFESIHAYYSTLFHELVHSTGHEGRLARPFDPAGIHSPHAMYAKEELVAEIGASMARAELDIDLDSEHKQSTAYLQSWISALQNDHSLIYHAAAAAQKAVDHIGFARVREMELTVEPELEEVESPDGLTVPTAVSRSLDEREAVVHALRLNVRRAETETPEVFAQHDIFDEMGRLQVERQAALGKGEDVAAIDDALAACSRKISILDGVEGDIMTREYLTSAARSAHLDDPQRLALEEADLETYRAETLKTLADSPEPWHDVIREQYGDDGLVRTLEFRARMDITDPEAPFGSAVRSDEEELEFRRLQVYMAQSRVSHQLGISR